MEELYQAHFGLTHAPFNVTPDPGFLYLSTSHREALAQLSYGIKARKGFVVLTGEVGTGKTTLIHSLLNDLGEGMNTALVFSTVISPIDLLRYVCEEFKLVDLRQVRAELHDYLVLLNEFLLEKYRNGENCVLIIDEAQNLSADILESIRVLSNFETSTDKLMQIVLVGQPELAARLNTPELRQLKQRVTLRHHLRALSPIECQEYIATRLKKSGGRPSIFAAAATDAIYQYSTGIPRLVNILCDNALLTAYAVGKHEIDAAIVREVAEDLNLTPGLEVYARHAVVNGLNGATAVHKVKQLAPQAPVAPKPISEPVVVNDFKSTVPSKGFVPTRILETVTDALTDAMGPMARIIIREQLHHVNVTAESLRGEKLWNLIDAVSGEICDELMRSEFRKKMADRIPLLEKG
ncbi:MAG: ExeA family protein [Alphaproteobacteria bacterium]